jgi:hypothetical protein
MTMPEWWGRETAHVLNQLRQILAFNRQSVLLQNNSLGFENISPAP